MNEERQALEIGTMTEKELKALQKRLQKQIEQTDRNLAWSVGMSEKFDNTDEAWRAADEPAYRRRLEARKATKVRRLAQVEAYMAKAVAK